MEVGDLVKRKETVYSSYNSIGYNDIMEVLEMKEGSSGNNDLIRMRKAQDKDRYGYHNEKSWFKAKNFKVFQERDTVDGKSDIFLVFQMLPQEDGTHRINLEAGAVQYNTEKEAKTAVSNQLEQNPESVWGIFPLAYLVKVEKPPVKFTVVWKK